MSSDDRANSPVASVQDDGSDMELERQTQRAMVILASSGVTAQTMRRHHARVRAQVVVEHYGTTFMESLKRLRETRDDQGAS